MKNNKKLLAQAGTKLASGLAISCLASQVFAAGYQIQEQNVTNLGLAYSGTAALAEDASTGYYNAAGLSRIKQNQVVVSAVGIHGDFDFDASSSTASFGQSVGAGSDDPGVFVAVPGLHLAARVNDKWVAGLNIVSPFGLKTEYDEGGVARYVATNSRLTTIDISPSIAYAVLPCLYIGGGADAMWVDVDLESQIGSNGANGADGFQKNHAEGWAYGWHAGIMWEPTDATRVGFNYRSKFNVHAEGDSDQWSADIGDGTQAYTLRTVRSKVVLPETYTFSFYQAFKQKYAVTGDVAYTNWSRFSTLRLRFDPGSTNALLTAQNITGIDTDTFVRFKDAWRYALGFIYMHDDKWTFKLGVAYDKSPTNDENRTARIPDEDRIWLGLGFKYTYNKNMHFDFGYAHLFFDDAKLDDRGPFWALTTQPASQARLQGEYDASANLLGVQMRYDFGNR